MSPAPKGNKKLILLISIIAGVLVVAGIALGVWLAFFHVSQADYQSAKDSASEIETANTDLKNAFSSYIDTADSGKMSDGNTALEAKIDDLNDALSDFDKERANKDKDIASSYDDLKSSVKDYTKKVKSFESLSATFDNYTNDCSKERVNQITSGDSSDFVGMFTGLKKMFTDCQVYVDEIAKSDIKELASAADKFSITLRKATTAVQDMIDAYNARDESKLLSAYSDLTDATNNGQIFAKGGMKTYLEQSDASDEVSSLLDSINDKIK